jgi:hypothetical protein
VSFVCCRIVRRMRRDENAGENFGCGTSGSAPAGRTTEIYCDVDLQNLGLHYLCYWNTRNYEACCRLNRSIHKPMQQFSCCPFLVLFPWEALLATLG